MTAAIGSGAREPIRLPGAGPYLLVIVDTEEEFDWNKQFSSAALGVTAMRHQWRAQRIFNGYGIVPTYMVDYPVAEQADGYRPLREFLAENRCEIGAHLHPWVNPPIEETVNDENSFACNLPRDLERRKLERLCNMIVRNLGVVPRVYRAGRYGATAATAETLAALGFKVDCSVLPWTDLRGKHGPDFSGHASDPFWFGGGRGMLEIPLTTGFLGLLHRWGAQLFPLAGNPRAVQFRFTGLCARLRLLDRVRLSPEGVTLDEAKRLTRALVQRGEQRVFTLNYHSPSLGVGNTPYVRSRAELERFLAWLDAYCDFFFGELGGVASTPLGIHGLAATARGERGDTPPLAAAGNREHRAAG